MSSAIEVYAFAVTFAAGTTPATPVTSNITIPSRKVVGIEADVPDGWNGMVGFAFTMANSQIIPANPGAWIIASGDVLHWNVDNLPDSGAWQVRGYNTGQYPHTLYVRFLCALVDASQDAGNATVQAVASLSSAVSAG
jgi:hypothetical protein